MIDPKFNVLIKKSIKNNVKFLKIIRTLGFKSRDSVPKLVEDYMRGDMKIDEFITHHFPLTGVNDAFKAMHDGEA